MVYCVYDGFEKKTSTNGTSWHGNILFFNFSVDGAVNLFKWSKIGTFSFSLECEKKIKSDLVIVCYNM